MECNRCLLSTDIPDVKLNSDGVCNFCELHDKLELESKEFDFDKFIRKLQKKKGYNCLIGISGGFDSSLMLHYAVRVWNLRPLVIHFDNGYNSEIADQNMMNLVKSLNVDFIRYHLNKLEYDSLCRSFLMAGVSDADIVNDMAMAELMYRTAYQYKIKWIFNGHNFRTEGTSPLCWSYMDSKYIESVASEYGQGVKTFPLLTFRKQLFYALIGIRNIRPFYYMHFKDAEMKELLKGRYNWQDYGGKHAENIYTNFVGSYYLPYKFNIDKRIIYLSALIRSGQISKNEAKIIYSKKPHFDEFDPINKRLHIDCRIYPVISNTHDDFKTYHSQFKKWKPLFWLMVKLKIFPRTFYIKYCR